MTPYAKRLKSSMDAKGVSISALAEGIGVSYQTVKKAMDGGSRSFGLKNNVEAAKALGVSQDWLAFGDGTDEPDEAHPAACADACKLPSLLAMELAQVFDELTDRRQRVKMLADSSAQIYSVVDRKNPSPSGFHVAEIRSEGAR